jgi:hypothetical protein
MGQYFLIANLDKKEYLRPAILGSGSKLWEITVNKAPRVLPLLLRQSTDPSDGGEYKSAGRWAGDRIVFIGDYDKSGLFGKIQDKYKEISLQTIKDYNDYVELPEEKISLKEALETMRLSKQLATTTGLKKKLKETGV